MTTPLLAILGPPRSFTTVVSAMLGQHPQMYGLPEVHLFGVETIAEWWQQCSEATFNMDHGLVRVVAQLFFGEQTEENVRRAAGWLQRRAHFTTGLLVEALAERVQPRILVDKSPSVVYHVETLRRVYAMFPQARFLHLVRHPRGHGESVMKYLRERRKLGPLPQNHWLLHLAAYPNGDEHAEASSDIDPQRAWLALHRNIGEFLEGVPANQALRVRSEDLVGSPERGLREVLAWLGLRTDDEAIEEMKHPERSPYACYGPRSAHFGNDRAFLQNPVLRPARAEKHILEGPLSWCDDGREFSAEVRELAQKFGYE
jgi:sulfotransferase family protein